MSLLRRANEKYNDIISEVKLKFKSEIDEFNAVANKRMELLTNSFMRMLDDLKELLSESDRKKVEGGHYSLTDIDFMNAFFNNGQSISDPSRLEGAKSEEEKKSVIVLLLWR